MDRSRCFGTDVTGKASGGAETADEVVQAFGVLRAARLKFGQ
jgi:hypothetical protein